MTNNDSNNQFVGKFTRIRWNDFSNISFSGLIDDATFAGLKDQIVANICSKSNLRSLPRAVEVYPEIQNSVIWRAVANYKDKFDELPRWMPCWAEYIQSDFTWLPSMFDPNCQ